MSEPELNPSAKRPMSEIALRETGLSNRIEQDPDRQSIAKEIDPKFKNLTNFPDELVEFAKGVLVARIKAELNSDFRKISNSLIQSFDSRVIDWVLDLPKTEVIRLSELAARTPPGGMLKIIPSPENGSTTDHHRAWGYAMDVLYYKPWDDAMQIVAQMFARQSNGKACDSKEVVG